MSEDPTLEALKSIQKSQVLLMENFSQSLQQITQVIKKGFEKLGSITAFTAPPPLPPSSAAAQSHPSSDMASSPGQLQILSTVPPPIALTASVTAPPPPATPAPPAQVTLTAPAPTPIGPPQITSPPLATSTPTTGFAADLDDEDTSALLESLCSLPSSPRESIFSCHDSHPPRNNFWPQHHPSTSPLQHMPAISPSHPPQGGYYHTTFTSSQTVLPPEPQESGAAVYPPMLAQGSSAYQLQPGVGKPQHSVPMQPQPQQSQQLGPQLQQSGGIVLQTTPSPGPAQQPVGHFYHARNIPTHDFSPQKSIEEILSHNRGESKAGKAAVHLAQFVYFGADTMRQSTAATLDVAKMREIKDIILGKYAIKRCAQDRNALWEKCKKAIGQKCKNLRYNK